MADSILDGGMFRGKRVKTSVTLPAELPAQIDKSDTNRSAFLERAANDYLARTARAAREAKDAEILRRCLDRFNRQAEESLNSKIYRSR